MPGRLARDIKQSKPFHSERQEAFFNLLRTTEHLAREASHILKEQDLSQTQYNVLRILKGAGDAGLPCSEIGNRLVSHDPDVTRLIDRLEKRALVSRNRDSSDRRVILIRLTPTGQTLVESCDADRRLDAVLAPHFARLAPGECQTLITLLENLRES
jgi:DNA-binding MarR family transcriptional regulator